MKKTLIALAVAGAAVATGVNAGELYNQDGTTLALGGRAEARMSIMDGDVSDKTRVRINISGKQEINDNLYGVGFYEAEYNTSDVNSSGTIDDGTNSVTTDNLEHRYAYAGIGGNFGEVTYGKNDAALSVITDFTDIMDYHGGNASNKFATADRIDNLLGYAGTFGDFAVKADYRFADRVDATPTTSYENNDVDGYSLSGIYTIADTGVALGLGFANQGGPSGSTNAGDQWMATASYTINDLYLAALYTAKDYDNTSNDYDAFELAASYTMDKTVFYVTYGDGSRDDSVPSTTTSSAGGDFYQEVAVEAAYFFKPNFRGFVSYNFDLRDDNETSVGKAEDEAALGLRYDF